MKNLYLVGGPMGVGKTTVCRTFQKMTDKSVFLDGDWCWDANPFTVTEETKAMVLDNICHLLGNFIKCSQYGNIIFSWVMHDGEIINTILSRLDLSECRVFSVSLICEKEELCRRLQRDVNAGVRTEDVISRSLERLPLYEKLRTEKLDTTHLTPGEAARALRDMAGE